MGELWLDGRTVLHSELPRPAPPPPVPGAEPLLERLSAFFAGAADDFADVELALVDDGFVAACARVLRSLPRGEVLSYGELAALAGSPGAARAAGSFCARNAFSPFVPCHRVVGANGLGGFGELGPDYKRRLLALEGVVL